MFTKDFWLYFFNTFKEAKWIIVRYLILSSGSLVVGVLANRMELLNLTYFSAVISLIFFAEMVAFAISGAVEYFTNQNIKNPEKVNNYIKIGFLSSIAFAVITAAVMLIFRDFILHNLLNLPTYIDYTFFYLMVGVYLVLTATTRFLTDALRLLKRTKRFMMLTLVKISLTILGFFLSFLIADMSLLWLAAFYIAAAASSLIAGYIFLLKDKDIPVNLLKFTKLRLTKQELKSSLYLSLGSIVWALGYMMIPWFLIQSNVVMFNQFTYFNNVLQMGQGFLFSFIIITSIAINRSMGEKKFDEAYRHAKYSLYATFIIWMVFFIVVLALIVPITQGMNSNIQQDAMASLLVYMVLKLIWFYEWNLGSYILSWGAEKVIFWQEFATMIYIVAFYITSIFVIITGNLYLLYLIIMIPAIIKVTMNIVVFKRKKWLKCVASE